MPLRLNPITRKRLNRFRSMRRAWWSFWLLLGLYGLSLMANVLSNDLPLLVRYEGRTFFPVFRFYPDDIFTGSGLQTRPQYKTLRESDRFTENPGNFMIFPIIPFSPHEIIPPERIDIPDLVTLRVDREPRVGSLDFTADFQVVNANNALTFFDVANDAHLRNRALDTLVTIPPEWEAAVRQRFENTAAPSLSSTTVNQRTGDELVLALSAFEPGPRPPRRLRTILREASPAAQAAPLRVVFTRDLETVSGDPEAVWALVTEEQRLDLLAEVARRFEQAVPAKTVETAHGPYRVRFEREAVTYPFRPTRQHPFGLDSSGRDVFAQILYALRTSMSFGLLLVTVTLAIGIVIGALQGYFGGILDITSQRIIEIWSALPFLYIIILLGNIYGRSFTLLLICYGIFNWIGISYYIRAEFLKLRKMPFVEAARVMGLRRRVIIFKHILPNALVPVITFFPFSLVGAIGSLAALDYLGFGLPPTTPSWGALLAQAQEFRFAWWLVLYPSLALFVVILLGVFIGEGVRSAFDPRAESRME
jgi:microcin C transport system permease protein